MDQEKKEKITQIDNLILKIVLLIFILIIAILVTLILFKFAIEKKLIFKLSHYI